VRQGAAEPQDTHQWQGLRSHEHMARACMCCLDACADCRRKFLLKHFGEQLQRKCERRECCDWCVDYGATHRLAPSTDSLKPPGGVSP
jgi:superfamily II DNA helicase RecQ